MGVGEVVSVSGEGGVVLRGMPSGAQVYEH